MNKETWNAIINKTHYVEFDWFGFDKLGRIAVFSSFNEGFIPHKVTKSFDKFVEFEQLVKNLPKIGRAKLYTKNSGDFSDWISYAEKGLVSFDYQEVHCIQKTESYDLIAKSRVLLSILNIPNFKYFYEILPEFNLDFDDIENQISFLDLENSEFEHRNLT